MLLACFVHHLAVRQPSLYVVQQLLRLHNSPAEVIEVHNISVSTTSLQDNGILALCNTMLLAHGCVHTYVIT
jgi:hypothetical protein